jgi:O-antigen ligase
MQGWLSASSLIGMLVALWFATVANRDLRRGVLVYVVLGAVPVFEVGAFSGAEMVQGMPLAEVLATVLIVIWQLQRHQIAWRRLQPFESWLLLILPASLLSLASGYAWLDHAVSTVHVNVAVSIGQILLFAWPILLYLLVADLMDRSTHRAQFSRVMLLLALPQWVMLAVPASTPYLFWSTTFGLIAAPLAMARATLESIWWKKLLLALYILPPLIEGVRIGKAFLYGYILLSTVIILYVRLRRVVLMLLPVVVLVGALAVIAPGAIPVPGFVQDLVETEEAQQSLGGRSGRGQLMEDAIAIWSGYPLLGVGPGNSYPYMLHYSVLGTPHSQYADLLLECGLVGVIVFAGFLASTVRYGWLALKRPRDGEDEVFLVAWFSSFAAMAVVSVTGDYMLHSIRNGGIEMFTGFYVHWLFLGLTMSMLRRDGEARVAARPAPSRVAPLVWTGPQKRQPAAARSS